MALWNVNDGENSKPNWLTEEQKRQCFRTIRGWEIPLAGNGFTNSAENVFGGTASGSTSASYLYRSPNFVGMTELLVAMPFDPSSVGATHVNAAGRVANEKRGQTSAYGQTSAGDLPNYQPYFTSPSVVVSGNTGQTVFATRGITSYIPIIAADANLTDTPRKLIFGLTTSSGQGLTGLTLKTGFTASVFSALYDTLQATSGTLSLTGLTLAARQNLVFAQSSQVRGMTQAGALWDANTKASYVVNRYGGIGGITQGTAFLEVGAIAVTGDYALRMTVNDGRPGASGATGTINFTLTVTGGTVF